MSRNRNYSFTLNNYSNEEYEFIKNIECNYMVVGKETGENETPHLQGYINFKNAKSFKAVKKLMPRAHIEISMGTAKDNLNYCSKQDKEPFIKGEMPIQGRRVDLEEITADILKGNTNVESLLIERPTLIHQYGRTLDRVEDLKLRGKHRNFMTEGIWIWGETGTGKSTYAFEGFTPETHYLWNNDRGWWDGYRQQETVILNDFRGEIPYNALLQMIDKFPFSVNRRNREPMPFLSKKVIITSSLPPERIYHNRMDEDNIEQLLRRVKVIETRKGLSITPIFENCTEVPGGVILAPPGTRTLGDLGLPAVRDSDLITDSDDSIHE